MAESRFVNFVTHFWIKYQRFRGAAALCAIVLNFILLIFKAAVCAVILIYTAPFMAAHSLLCRPNRGVLNKILYVPLVLVCLVLCVPLAIMPVIAIQCTGEMFYAGLTESAIVAGGVTLLLGALSVKSLLRLVPFILHREIEETEEDDIEEETEDEAEYEAQEELLDEDDIHFCQLFTLGEEMCLLIDHVEMCPDETALIRVAGEEGYTPIYKRKVRRDKAGNRFIVFNGTNYYLDDSKTQPTVPMK